MTDQDILANILTLFRERGAEEYGGEAVTQLEHALQTATLARANHGSPALVSAALLHDIGHLLDDDGSDEAPHNLDDAHEARGYQWLCDRFGPAVSDPVRLHVAGTHRASGGASGCPDAHRSADVGRGVSL